MKNKGMIIVIAILLLVIAITIFISENSQKYILKNGMMLAMTITDENGTYDITEFPKRGAYSVNISCGNTGKGKWLAEEWKLAVEDITGNVKCNIKFTSNPTPLKSKVETVNESQNYDENGYRYSGKTPNNWLWFNGEKWRIIGSIPTCTSSGCTTSENLVKIIRNESIGAYPYDASSTTTSELQGEWGSNTLYELLNTYYYATDKTKMNGQTHKGCYGMYSSSYQSKPNCDYTETGILASGYYGQMVRNVYWNTGWSSNSVQASEAFINETSQQTQSGYIGLMSASDWGYAASSSYHSVNISEYTSSSNSATETSWIFNNGNEWTLTQISNSTSGALYVTAGGTIDGSSEDVYLGVAIRPVVYLDSSVYIISGDGSEGNPYQIGM